MYGKIGDGGIAEHRPRIMLNPSRTCLQGVGESLTSKDVAPVGTGPRTVGECGIFSYFLRLGPRVGHLWTNPETWIHGP